MKTVRIVGVPEHFNLPWQMALAEGAFEQLGIDLIWEHIPEGTGRMCKMLAENKTDLAVILTEGICKSIVEGLPCRIVQEYISTSLQWGIHVAAESDFLTISDIIGKRAAISRFGSGSHLMSYILAQNEGWDTKALSFQVIHNLEGAVEALVSNQADYFMWEHFTTKPYVDNGVFRRIADCPTPWPCFVIAARIEFIEKQASTIRYVLDTINHYTWEFKNIPSIDRTLANRYGQQLDDIQEWLSKTEWSQSQISTQDIDNVINTLHQLKLIDNKYSTDKILTNL